MSRYRKIDVRMWRDENFRSLSAPKPNGRDCWIYLLTCPESTSIPGAYAAWPEQLARGLGWSLTGFQEAFAEAFAKGMAEGDFEAGFVFIPNAVKYNKPESPNVIRGWRDAWDELPECKLKTKAYWHLKAFAEGLGEGFAKAFREACGQPLANQEQEQEQEQEQDLKTHADFQSAGVRSEPLALLPTEPAVTPADLAAAYQAFPRKEGKSRGLEKLGKEIRTREQLQALTRAIANFAEQMRVEQRPEDKIKHFATWAAEWRDWADWVVKPPSRPSPQAATVGHAKPAPHNSESRIRDDF